MSIQVKRRREAASFLSTFTGAQAELLVDTTNNRVQVHDGTTAGGWPAAKLAEVVTNTRTAVADAAYTALVSDRTIAYTALTAARVVTLPAASAYPTGTRLVVFDESGSCSATNTITLARAGSDTIDGATSAVISSAYGYLALESNGVGKWTIVDQATSNLPPVGIGTAADPSNPLSVYGASALFNSAGNFNFTINKAASTNTASTIYEHGFSGRAQVGLCGDDNFHFKVSPDGSTWYDALDIAGSSGLVTANFGLMITGPLQYNGSTVIAAQPSLNNYFFGGAGNLTMTGSANTANGIQALYSNTTGSANTANGVVALLYNTTGGNNTANGYAALYSNTTGSANTANGVVALYSNTTGSYNTASGYEALYSNTTGASNVANGYQALQSNTTGANNTASGFQALQLNTTGSANTANGYEALQSNTTGGANTANGYEALYSNTTGSNNVANGYQALYSNTTGANNTASGFQALLYNTTGSSNTANGFQALQSNTTGGSNTANGVVALVSNTTGGNNVANGVYAGYNGSVSLQTMANSTFLGYGANSSIDGVTNSTAIGNGAQVTASNEVVIGNSSVTKTVLNGAIAIGGTTAIGSDRSYYLPSYTVATLPAPGTAGRMVFASNCRMFNGAGTQEGAAAGTGGLVTDNGTAWKIAGTNVTAIA